MFKSLRSLLAVLVACLALQMLGPVNPANAAESADSVFVGNVSQGGRYEVEASQLAVKRATSPDVKDLAVTEVHDHGGVNANLKKLADAAGIAIAPDLNALFQERLAKLNATSAVDFESAYIEDMKQIHDKDEKLFAKEAMEGTGAFKSFAHQTDLIVKRHIGALHGND